jgi:hypothetical protein
MAAGSSSVRIKVYGRRQAAVPFAASLLALLVCVNAGLAFLRDFVWLVFIPWSAFTALVSFDFWESRVIEVDREKKLVHLGRRKIAFPDIKSIGRTEVAGYADLLSFRRVKVKIATRGGKTIYFPLPFTPSIAGSVDRIVAELQKHTKTTGKL